jgi:hypothetical protein
MLFRHAVATDLGTLVSKHLRKESGQLIEFTPALIETIPFVGNASTLAQMRQLLLVSKAAAVS